MGFFFYFPVFHYFKLGDLGESFVDPRHEVDGHRVQVNSIYSAVEDIYQ